MSKYLFPFVICIVLLSCQDDENSSKNFSYVIVNTSLVDVGIRLTVNPVTSGYALTGDSVFQLPVGKEVEFLRAEGEQPLGTFLTAAKVTDPTYKQFYKNLDLTHTEVSGNTTKIKLWLANPNGKPVVKVQGRYARIDIDETHISGYLCSDQDVVTYFKTNDDFLTLRTDVLSTRMDDAATVYRSGNTIIAADMQVYSEPTNLVISYDNGASWNGLASFLNAFGEDFVATEFISPTEGWVFKYRDWKATDVYKISGTTYSKISTIPGYCVRDVVFLNATNGYVISTPNNQMSPADGASIYFFKTTDGGQTWQGPVTVSTTRSGSEVFAFPSGRLMILAFDYNTYQRLCYASNDNGATWQEQNMGVEGIVWDIDFVTPALGFLKTAVRGELYEGPVYKTTDEGKTWKKLSDELVIGSRIEFYNEQIGYSQTTYYGRGQYLYVTRDGGVTWKEVLYPYPYMK